MERIKCEGELEAATTDDEDSAADLGRSRRSDSPLFSPISAIDHEIMVLHKIEHAARKLWLHMVHWNRLFPDVQWRSNGPYAVQVLRDMCLLRHIVPFVKRVTNLDGKVWEHWILYDEEHDVVRPCTGQEQALLVVHKHPRLS